MQATAKSSGAVAGRADLLTVTFVADSAEKIPGAISTESPAEPCTCFCSARVVKAFLAPAPITVQTAGVGYCATLSSPGSTVSSTSLALRAVTNGAVNSRPWPLWSPAPLHQDLEVTRSPCSGSCMHPDRAVLILLRLSSAPGNRDSHSPDPNADLTVSKALSRADPSLLQYGGCSPQEEGPCSLLPAGFGRLPGPAPERMTVPQLRRWVPVSRTEPALTGVSGPPGRLWDPGGDVCQLCTLLSPDAAGTLQEHCRCRLPAEIFPPGEQVMSAHPLIPRDGVGRRANGRNPGQAPGHGCVPGRHH